MHTDATAKRYMNCRCRGPPTEPRAQRAHIYCKSARIRYKFGVACSSCDFDLFVHLKQTHPHKKRFKTYLAKTGTVLCPFTLQLTMHIRSSYNSLLFSRRRQRWFPKFGLQQRWAPPVDARVRSFSQKVSQKLCFCFLWGKER